ncbi:aldolase [Saccharopolyspora gloriosae]|uniref:Ribulose-5-phosphate 4-epimerase/fuculose-1-phosphate aldolase n=1 Tax=Saccharopolyspora gloriosae TaxID=455344 RepID=A0A840ND52_9PSEU|nr:class II aldolase/adducin family protein [Saccharopolyspora gloriosae]MBB5068881.1 ribulose-5-phosphate 4-epimerase/fuculose-1-phosphate aldolase [Saccharopolyspora gloriosae]
MSRTRKELVAAGARLAALGLSPGSSGNLSVRVGDRMLLTPTGADLAELDPEALSELSLHGEHLAGPRPSKEFPLHGAFYRRDPGTGAVVHLHSRNAAGVACLAPWSPRSAIPPLTPYFVMRVGQSPLIPYAAPGDPAQADVLEALDFDFRAALLQNHGPITSGATLAAAVDAAVEIEEVSALLLRLGSHRPRLLEPEQIRELTAKYGTTWDG